MLLSLLSFAVILEVGPGKQFPRIEEAVKAARAGDEIWVFPDPSNYRKTAVRLTIPLKVKGVGKTPVSVKGDGFEFSGAGSVPRAIIEVESSASGSIIQNLELSGAHNDSFNGAGIRIQAANDVRISDCIIHDNDMGIMSNGKQGDPKAGSNQLIEFCLIEKNGNIKDPGYNHNLYLGGTSVRINHCEIRNSTTGHNVKSRAHYTVIEHCWIHDAANREIDLPEAWDTERRNSNAVLIENQIIKDPTCNGNRGVVHFGQEKGVRNGSLYLFRNTLFTPFASPVILVTSAGTNLVAQGNAFLNPDQSKAALWQSEKSDLKVEFTDSRSSACYGVIPGTSNLKSSSKSDFFNQLAPRYAVPISGSEISTWIDGEGVKQSVKAIAGHVCQVGPRK